MNNQMIQMINQLKSVQNPRQAAMQCLQNASKQGNVMAQGLLKDIESGDMGSAQNTLTNYMQSKGADVNAIINIFK